MWRGTYIAWIPMAERGRIHNVTAERDCKRQSPFLRRQSAQAARHDAVLFRVSKNPEFRNQFLFLIGFFAHCLYIIEKLNDEHIRNKND